MLESNKLIAEFLGINLLKPLGYNTKVLITEVDHYQKNKEGRINLITEDSFGVHIPNVTTVWVELSGVESIDYNEPLDYSSDWNLLMLVVEKIETLPMQPEFFVMYDNREEFKGWYWNISVSKLFNKDCLDRESTKIIAYYNACVEFIKWYSENGR